MKQWKMIMYILLGNFLVACGTTFFILPNNILNGGTAGVAVALQPLFHIDTVWMTNALTVGLYGVGVIFLGKRFAMRSLISTICYPVFILLLNQYVNTLPRATFIMPAYLASIYSGLLLGVGLGLVFRVDASTGGMDVPALILHKYTQLSSGDAVMIVDIATVALGIYTYGLVPALIGILSVYISGAAINRTMTLRSQAAKNVMIISDSWQVIKEVLLNEVDRGVTILEGHGGYTGNSRPVLMCVINQKQYPKLEQAVLHKDPHAFIIVNDVQEVKGYGFSYEEDS
ncbi:MAG: YitT family protein [Absicoccus porci]|uniref:YitT family protein n=1 Tax=Absicoccus porci TaxID=2486576 RepID=UPI0023563D0D|nr:YitT family protein [Absicoccus porci]MCI6087614.1 YitT family protein [Absicoccus porci]MDD7330549.1 YitT family protein [Absicoccus porci]MDY4738603.1 YitT family protein [Absicoccus porci]